MSLNTNKQIAAVVVTFNKKELLRNAVQGILNQELLPDLLLIIDNNSSDGTYDMLLENGWIEEINDDKNDVNLTSLKEYYKNEKKILIKYVSKFENDGGAGGFYEGMKQAYNDGYEWLWLMDDDGVPAKDCLKYLYDYKTKDSVIGPLVVDIETKKTASFLFDNKGQLSKVDELLKEEVLEDKLTPFNGTFIPSSIIKKIGFIKKEMFIWGDEQEYQLRILKNGFSVKTITKAIHYHPVNKKKPKYRSDLLKFTIYDISNPKFQFIFFRNYIFLEKKYPALLKKGFNIRLIKLIYEALINSIYNLVIGDYLKSKICLRAIKYGLRSDFSLVFFEEISLKENKR
jgi:rhamnopyranosyl-N-acetylglucosaminyl-diphospho-decaprenol beta-1,3/1,4-galactofuranosyltransferase